ncbi:pyruvate oxidase [Propionibacterium freudenreichii]|uniref:pyruvate oxidase n=1 Tax=Propionibacterium freudenreichii TaxID=1744 RepID=UPI0021A9173C|nr:pyruvate oxidase [Propionibacterium freudenreichii]MCT2980041.1 pyruvate oxidase [Propionibacterium freudenreichii]
MTKVNASNAMLQVLKDWGVDTIYGLPGGSFDSTMNAIHDFRDDIRYIGVRHEEVGALAAVAEAKLTGKIAVTFGSAGPGAAHLLNGLYDAKTDNIPVLALIGQVPTAMMNTDFFQELNENPMFADVSVYARTVTTAEQLPQVVDTAIRTAYSKRGVAVVIIPKDLGWAPIEDNYVSSANAFTPADWNLAARDADVARALDLINEAQRPILYYGQGAKGAGDEIRALSELLGLPMVSTYLGKGIVADDDPGYMLPTGRVAGKPGVDVGKTADLVLFAGSNYEFGGHMFSPTATFIDVNLETSVIGARHAAALGVRADAPTFLRQLLELARQQGDARNDHADWLAAAKQDKAEWTTWVDAKAADDREPIRIEPIYAEINKHAKPDAIFGIDVGNVNISSGRFLKLGGDKRMVTSPLYATMGFGLPAGIAAALKYQGRQIWTLSGDGGFAMVVQDLATQAAHNLPVINIVFTNKSLGYIEAEQDDTRQPHSGVALTDVDFAKVAEAFGVKGYTVRTLAELRRVLDEVSDTKVPVVIDIKVTNDRMLPVEAYPVNRADRPDFDDFAAHYEATPLRPFVRSSPGTGFTWADLPRRSHQRGDGRRRVMAREQGPRFSHGEGNRGPSLYVCDERWPVGCGYDDGSESSSARIAAASWSLTG